MNVINHALLLDALERYPWRNLTYARGRLNASSPFGNRADNTPSFSVIIDPDSLAFGCFVDSGARDPAWARGSPIKLYAWLRNITEQESFALLYEPASEAEALKLRIRLRLPEPPRQRKPIDIAPYISAQPIPYLSGRGITPIIQRLYRCGFDNAKNAVVMPWTSPNGSVLNAKWRSTWGKAFWYYSGGSSIRSMIYGIDIAYKRSIKRATVTEGEIDTMSAATAGTFGLAVGGSEFTDEKADMLKRSPIEELLIAADNDAAGEKLRWQIERKMRGHVRLSYVGLPSGTKDLNEVLTRDGPEGLREVLVGAKRLNTLGLRIGLR